MTTIERLAASQQLRDSAMVRAQALRRQAVHDFWSAAARVIGRVLQRRPAAEVS